MTGITLDDMIAEIRRELRTRELTYASAIKRGALSETAAQRQNARLSAALSVLTGLREIIEITAGRGPEPPLAA
jgi:hypothetical protein